MPFNHLLFESLLPGKTTAEDRKSGCHTSAEPRTGCRRSGSAVSPRRRRDPEATWARRQEMLRSSLFLLKRRRGNQSLDFCRTEGHGHRRKRSEQILNAHRCDLHAYLPHVKSKTARAARAVIVAPTVGTLKRQERYKSDMKEQGHRRCIFGTTKPSRPCTSRELIGDLDEIR